jgi:hypothetical protein
MLAGAMKSERKIESGNADARSTPESSHRSTGARSHPRAGKAA